MAGVKGRSGGARPGAGRKKKAPTVLAPVPAKPATRKKTAAAPAAPVSPLAGIGQEGFDPRPALEQVAKGLIEVSPQQFKALTALLPYVHTKKGDGGIKDERAERAKKAGAGKFGSAPPPLALVKH
jgi:phage terminase small subunit